MGYLGEGIDILREALATVTELAIRTRDVGMGVVDVAREEASGMDGTPVGSHLLAVLTAGVEVDYLIRAKYVVHVLGELCFKRCHDGELLADEDLGEKIYGSGEDHGLLLEVFDVGTLGEKLWHVVYTMVCFL